MFVDYKQVIAELVGTYFLIFAGCATIEVDLDEENAVTLLGKAIAWGLAVMVLVYSVGHISGPHFNPAITIAFASCQKFPWKQVDIYMCRFPFSEQDTCIHLCRLICY